MRAAVGDRIVTQSDVVGRPAREGVVTQVKNPDGSPPFTVRWDGSEEETLVHPGPDTVVRAGDSSAHAS